MIAPTFTRSPAHGIARTRGQELVLGFLFWIAFLLVLEPGNVARAIADGGTLPLGEEIIRILGAACLGAVSTPLVLALMRRFPIEGRNLWRHATIHTLGNAAIAMGLIVASCILAAWFKVGDSRPVFVALPDEIAANWLLLIFCIGALSAVAHAVHFFRRAEAHRAAAAPVQIPEPARPFSEPFLTRLPVKSRGGLVLVELATVDWIETQGNYLALHAGAAVHLIRETSVRFEAKLSPAQFVRIHRRALVALDRIREMTPLANGDASVRLNDGTDLRVSRGFREKIRAALTERARAA